MSFAELAASRWTCRKYAPAPVEDEKLDIILDTARKAPSAHNFQPTRIWVCKSDEALARIRQVTPCHYGAPLMLIVGYDKDVAWTRDADGKCYGEVDASIVGTHIILQAADLGLASTWVGAYDPAKLVELFPELGDAVAISLFTIGYPAEDAAPAPGHTELVDADTVITCL